MKIHKEIVWNKGENPNKDGTYLYAQFSSDGLLLNIATVGYTKKIWVEFKQIWWCIFLGATPGG